jgi:hypothetical protein
MSNIERLIGFKHRILQSNAGAQIEAMQLATPYELSLPDNPTHIEHAELPQINRIDPAAVALNTMSSSTHAILSATIVPPKSSQWRRDKMV